MNKVLLTIILFFMATPPTISGGVRLQRDGPIARDFINKLEWMRCSVGQVWSENTCEGEILLLSIPEAEELVERLGSLNGGGWRLPTSNELAGLVTKKETRPDDVRPNIDSNTFPNTLAGPYWSSDVSFYSSRYQWSVNFLTGHKFNRFFPKQKLAIRLVRDYER